jgi:F-type H+-transporting ATPase subunit delta
MLSAIGNRYARALVDVITAPGFTTDPQKALEELRAVDALIRESGALHIALLSPAVSPSRKRAVLARLLEPMAVSKAVRNFVFVVVDHRRVHQFASIVEAFDRQLDERLGFIRGDVVSATALTDSQRADLEAELSRLSGRKAKIEYVVNPALIGGVVARVGAKVYDGSVRGQLEKLRSKLASGELAAAGGQ